MTKISFYILPSNSASDRQVFACRLAEKAYLQGHHVYIHTSDAAQTDTLNKLLWSFRSDSFVPHTINADQNDADTPVIIGHAAPPPRLMDVLINLDDEQQPLFFSQFERLAEIIDDNEPVKQAGRSRFQFYKQRGYELETFHI